MKFLATLILIIFSTQSVSAAFSDTEFSWYEKSINKLQSEGIISGQSDGTFKPDWAITRAEILKIIMGAAGTQFADTSTQCFPDVDPAMWYSKYICAALERGITQGFSDGKFKPNETVTYLEALAFGLRAFELDPESSGAQWYLPYQKIANDNKILQTASYTLNTKLARGKATEIIERIKEYSETKMPINTGSIGCSLTGKSLEAVNTISINGVDRKYNLHVPSGYSNAKKYNLVVALHGRTNSNDMVQSYMGLQSKAGSWSNQDGTTQSDSIVVYPAGVKVSGGYSWTEWSNITFFDAILEEVSDTYCIDRDKVYVVGHSLGGWFSNKLSCVRGDVIRAMASVGGPGFGGDCTGPAASIIFQKKDDHLVSYASGKYAETNRRAINLCKGTTTDVKIGTLSCKQWSGCSSGNPVIWCETYTTYQNDPHGWPRSGGSLILDFFRGL